MRNNKNNKTLSFKNIIFFLNNLIGHFTDNKKIITLYSKNLILCFIILILSLLNITNTSALNYENSVGIGFTFSPTLSVSLSNGSLSISELALGATGVSNEINVAVNTNIAYGYTLSATVGNDSNYNGDSLYNSVDHTNTFTNIATDADLTSLSDGNTWGYSYKDNTASTPTWSNYNGLPLYSSTAATLLDTTTNTSGSADIKIAAKVGSSQASGEYNNVINFTVVSKPIPVTLLDAFIAYNAKQYNGYYTMQSMTPEICSLAEEGSELQLIDIRDNKLYWIAKLKDHNCWMTQNLDFDLVSDPTAENYIAINSVTSDIDPTTYNTGIYTQANGYSKDETTGVVSWLPSTIVNVDDGQGGTTPVQRADTIVMNGNSAPNWTNNNNNPYSADPGERYRYTNPSSYSENTYTSLATCAQNNSNDTVGCEHSHFGNYYNWPAAAATNDASIAQNNSTWSNSVCPKNWDLPANGKYTTLMTAQGVFSSGSSYATGGFNKLRTAPLYFQRFGLVDGGSLSLLGSNGLYWSSTVYNSTLSYALGFGDSNIWPSVSSIRYFGFSVRCMVGSL